MRSATRIALVLLVAGMAAAQVKESLTVSYVEVPVTVVDRGGNPIKGLTAANFEIVDAAIANPQNFRANDPLQLAGASFDKEALTALTSGGRGGELDALKDIARVMDQQQDQYNRQKIEKEINLLSGLTKMLRAVRGQKHLILLSEGFDPRLIQGR